MQPLDEKRVANKVQQLTTKDIWWYSQGFDAGWRHAKAGQQPQPLMQENADYDDGYIAGYEKGENDE